MAGLNRRHLRAGVRSSARTATTTKTSFIVSRRTREIGIRMALGGAPRQITTSIFSRAFMQIAIGALAGGVPSVSMAAFGDGDVFSGVGLAAGLGVTCAVGALVFGVSVVSCLV